MPVRMIVTTLALSAVMAAPTCGDEPGRPLVIAAQARGLRVVPWTFDADRDALAHFFREYRVDGLFGDYPDVAVAVRDRASTP